MGILAFSIKVLICLNVFFYFDTRRHARNVFWSTIVRYYVRFLYTGKYFAKKAGIGSKVVTVWIIQIAFKDPSFPQGGVDPDTGLSVPEPYFEEVWVQIHTLRKVESVSGYPYLLEGVRVQIRILKKDRIRILILIKIGSGSVF